MYPIREPICTEEPSRPKDSPEAMLKMPPINLAMIFLNGDLYVIFPSNKALVCGSPLPVVVGYSFTIKFTMLRKITIKTNNIRYLSKR